MKIVLVAALIASVHCVPYGGFVNTGHSDQFREDDGYGNYEFGYNEDHATGGTFRKEKGGPGYQVGSYGLRDADGRLRIVHYIADAHGFRATITSNEPGVDTKQSPAATSMTGAYAPLAMSHTAIAPVAVTHQTYPEPPLYSTDYAPVLTKPTYTPIIANKYTLSPSALLSTQYHTPILKSTYVPTLTSTKYHSILSNGHFGDRTTLYNANPYQGYY